MNFDAFKRRVRRTGSRASQVAVTQDLQVDAIRRILARGGFLPHGGTTGQAFDATSNGLETGGRQLLHGEPELLERWASGLAECGTHAVVYGRDECGCTGVVLACCDTPPCSRHQRKVSRRWDERSDALYGWLEHLRRHPEPLSPEECERLRVERKEASGKDNERKRRLLDAKLYAAQFAVYGKGQQWVHVEIGVQGGDVDKTLDTRAKFARHMERNYHSTAAYMALDLGGKKQSPHFHAVMLCDYAPRENLQRWLRSTDCTVPGCSHEADDRCEACRKAKRRCSHKRADGKPRCNGSWYVHVEAIGTECPVCKRHVGKSKCCGMTFAERARKGFREVLKYAAAPVEPGNAPVPGEPFSERQLQHSERVVEFFVETRHRHRIETYGAAKLDVVELGLAVAAPELARGCCPCGQPWNWEMHGWRKHGVGYQWGAMLPYKGHEGEGEEGDTGPPETPGQVWTQEVFPGFGTSERPSGMREV